MTLLCAVGFWLEPDIYRYLYVDNDMKFQPTNFHRLFYITALIFDCCFLSILIHQPIYDIQCD
jgi:hypothetical protein